MTFMGDTVDISDASDIQFRFVQEEHAGGFCNCWDIDNLMLMNGPPPSALLMYAVIANVLLQDLQCLPRKFQ